ncbi:DUF397 domain-containing protein [Streptosporangium sp. 'caverna']|uniref:DUF397 domain-containing protein n=1 Tax=Streptosporangium sp. 'caverna' TaxID=2202249 RepID=UPI000D7DEC36|nr:DUF397 domain-containing protein [Streptosporangium sp. 'caverna']AWS40019.1 DUF397 domain-containing protein [Streptosporangium sp. 'caverna']
MDPVDLLIWKKSSRSAANGNCVEVTCLSGRNIGVRDSKNRTGPVLVFDHAEWAAFVGGVKGGEFDF